MQTTHVTAEPWPNGVTARYLAVGGATVDLVHGNRYYPTEDGIGETRNHTSVTCLGCQAAEEFSHWATRTGITGAKWMDYDPDAADTAARAWAQKHAAECRAMPRPEADR
ncbi:hypothetical protein [Streptomyces sp. NPDC018352]|uniref:hypothetical protein n=1 Tax=Streptomyces sp. NPDC018352 TaxID=3157194 RepID=UPI00340787BB